MDTAVTSLKLLSALSLIGVIYLVLLPYFWKPEEFFVERLRPERNQGLTHGQLLVRAFVGAGLVSAALHSLAFCIALSLVLDLKWAWMWPAMTLSGGLVVGTGTYLGFRFLRYRRLTSDERARDEWSTGDVFARRA